uniref:Signal recognition particle receptor subunit beta n=1 Tax=Timspurckia oligopyrenoides TaxID=708627 RepID=A0A7S0ZFV0_9RHOD|mmetsp:Transcript_366/g.664  ORF Transcript_366/g.664 Transcript_366/m.664 type:complete len:293 (+) Transcript_366:66-944(+)
MFGDDVLEFAGSVGDSIGVSSDVVLAILCVIFVLVLIVLIVLLNTLLAKFNVTQFDPRDSKCIVIAGPSVRNDEEAPGKTTLFFLLKNKCIPKYGIVSSLDTSEAVVLSPVWKLDHSTSVPITVIDVPGAPSAQVELEKALAKASAVIFVIDSRKSSFDAHRRDYARVLYNILTHSVVSQWGTPTLLLCNKQDAKDALVPSKIQTALEQELQRERASRQSALKEISDNETLHSQSVDVPASLGFADEVFEMSHVNGPVECVGCSLKNNQLEPIYTFVLSHVVTNLSSMKKNK